MAGQLGQVQHGAVGGGAGGAHLADDDSIRAHPQAIHHEVARGDEAEILHELHQLGDVGLRLFVPDRRRMAP